MRKATNGVHSTCGGVPGPRILEDQIGGDWQSAATPNRQEESSVSLRPKINKPLPFTRMKLHSNEEGGPSKIRWKESLEWVVRDDQLLQLP